MVEQWVWSHMMVEGWVGVHKGTRHLSISQIGTSTNDNTSSMTFPAVYPSRIAETALS